MLELSDSLSTAVLSLGGIAWLRFLVPLLLLCVLSRFPAGAFCITVLFFLRGFLLGCAFIRLLFQYSFSSQFFLPLLMLSGIALLAFFLVGEDCFSSARLVNAARKRGMDASIEPVSASRLIAVLLLLLLYIFLSLTLH